MIQARLVAAAIAALAMVTVGPNAVMAQSLFGSNSAISQSGGGSSFGGASGTTSGQSSSGFSSAFGGAGAGGQAGGSLDTSGLGSTSGMNGPQLNTELGALSNTIGQGGFVGGADTAGRFVGNQGAGQQSIQSTNVRAPQAGQFGNRGNNEFNNNNRQTGLQARRVVRPRLKINFDYPQAAPTRVQANLDTQFRRLRTNRQELQNVELTFGDNREVTLRGRVSSEEDKKLAAMLARLEPGVRTIKNELEISSN